MLRFISIEREATDMEREAVATANRITSLERSSLYLTCLYLGLVGGGIATLAVLIN